MGEGLTEAPPYSRGEQIIVLLTLAVSAVILLVGWDALWFECDDAYIAFRYVGNAMLDRGYTWNPLPFAPVEGYTSFLWVVILDVVWRAFGIGPEMSATAISLVFGYVMLGITAAMALHMRLSERLLPWRATMFAAVVLATVINRTFLMWTSSGLETALESTLLLGWVSVATLQRPFGPWGKDGSLWMMVLAGLAALMALTRPDGLLFVAASGVVWTYRYVRGQRGAADIAAGWPFLVPVSHLLWRHHQYGWWLPNTYYAKHVGAWPLAGLIYLTSFVLEYHWYIWIAVALAAVVRVRSWAAEFPRPDVISAFAIGTVVCHFLYYTFDVGGDHFEYRIYQHLVPLLFVSFPLLCDRLHFSPRRTLGLFAAMVLLGLYLPWMEWNGSRHYDKWDAPQVLAQYRLPRILSWYGRAWDWPQSWLRAHFIGARYFTHREHSAIQRLYLPTRSEGLAVEVSELHIFLGDAVGVPGWRMPNVAIIDRWGLNDEVVARSPRVRRSQWDRHMAHDRSPPVGYCECFRADVVMHETRDGYMALRLGARDAPLTAADVVDCEASFLDWVRRFGW